MRSLSWVAVALCDTLLLCSLLALVPDVAHADDLEALPDAELEKLIKQEQYVIVLFGTGDDRSSDFEAELATVREDLVDSLNAWVVKSVSDSRLRAAVVGAELQGPAVVFYRKRVPVLYDGPANEEEILESISLFKEPCVRELNDNTFEHQTQAATGATTGDWFVLFVKDDCPECDVLRARWEAIACKFKNRINVARVNRGTSGAVTGRRFDVTSVPQAIFFRFGKLYRYTVEKYDIESMSSFMTGWYKNVKSEPVPLPKTPFDDVVQLCVDYIREEPVMVGLVTGVPLVLALAFFFLTRSTEKPKSEKKKKKAKDSEKKND